MTKNKPNETIQSLPLQEAACLRWVKTSWGFVWVFAARIAGLLNSRTPSGPLSLGVTPRAFPEGESLTFGAEMRRIP